MGWLGMARSVQVTARERAREARRRLAARRAERERLIEEAATRFFAGQEMVDQGTREMQDAVQALHADLGESAEEIAELLEVPTKVVSRLRREAAKRDENGSADSDVQTDEDESAEVDRHDLPDGNEGTPTEAEPDQPENQAAEAAVS